MDIVSYIQSKVRVPIKAENVEAILLDRGVDKTSQATDVSARDRELLYADALMFLYTSASSVSGETTQHGGFTYKSSGESMNRIYRFRRMANNIYKKYRDKNFDSTGIVNWADNDF